MNEKKWENYITDVLSYVKFKFDHRTIRKELQEHMEDLCEDLKAEGMDAEIAESLAVDCMGDATEVGQALNKEHGVILGWICLAAKVSFFSLSLSVFQH